MRHRRYLAYLDSVNAGGGVRYMHGEPLDDEEMDEYVLCVRTSEGYDSIPSPCHFI